MEKCQKFSVKVEKCIQSLTRNGESKTLVPLSSDLTVRTVKSEGNKLRVPFTSDLPDYIGKVGLGTEKACKNKTFF